MDISPASDRLARLQLRLVQATLLLLLAGTALVGYRIAGWPIITWTMYGRHTTPFPPPRTSAIELRVRTRTGERITISPVELFGIDRFHAAELTIEAAFNEADSASRADHRRYLAEVVRQIRKGKEPEIIEGWSLEWAVVPCALPPLDRQHPIREVRLGAFVVTASAGAAGGDR